MSTRRHFLELFSLSVAAGSLGCSRSGSRFEELDRLGTALLELNYAAQLGIDPTDFDLARDYAAGAYREAKLKLRGIRLDDTLDLPVAFSAKRGA